MKPKLIKNSQCTGCGACASVCMHEAIIMNYDRNGYLKPIIDGHKCIQCRLCEKRCPIINLSQLEFYPTTDIRNFSAWSNNDEVCLKASSGGIFSQLAINILKNNNAIVYGAHLTQNNTVHHIGITREQDLHLIVGTKYIQSNASVIYRECKTNLENAINVLFCGTPCQIAGLYAVLGFKHYENLLTVELICHGVGSQVAAEVATKYYGADYIVSNRDKEDGWATEVCRSVSQKSTYSKNGKLIKTSPEKDIFYTCFNNTHRMSCTNCHFAHINRISDLSLGDQWGLYKSFLERGKLGVSLVIANTPKGMQTLKQEQITVLENPNNILNAYPLFCSPTSRWETIASWLWLFRKFPNKIAVSFITLNWRKNPLVIPFKIIQRCGSTRKKREIIDTIKTTKEREGWI